MTEKRLTGFHQDEDREWVAELECGHFQHVRHNPPWTNRPWILSEETRAAVIGQVLRCRKCEYGAPLDREIR